MQRKNFNNPLQQSLKRFWLQKSAFSMTFNISPIKQDIFFSSETFIGNGLLQKLLLESDDSEGSLYFIESYTIFNYEIQNNLPNDIEKIQKIFEELSYNVLKYNIRHSKENKIIDCSLYSFLIYLFRYITFWLQNDTSRFLMDFSKNLLELCENLSEQLIPLIQISKDISLESAPRNHGMRFTTFPVIQPINQKNYYTEYLKREDQLLMCRAATWSEEGDGDEGSDEDDEKQTNDSKVLVIHPGSLHLRIGLASDAFPRTIPNVIAHRQVNTSILHPTSTTIDTVVSSLSFENSIKEIDIALKARLKLSKRRIQTNAHEQVIAYNQSVVPEMIANPAEHTEWTNLCQKPSFLVGNKALKIPPDAIHDYAFYWPIRQRAFNARDYTSSRQCVDDFAAILVAALGELGMKRADWTSFSVVLVIPDIYDKDYVQAILDLLIRTLQFSKVSLLQESVCTAFGAGLSATCVVDVGAQTTSIACVEEGICLPESRIQLPYGGDDVTRFFIQLLQRSQFPYKEIDLKRVYDWQLAENLKIQHCTANESNATVQLLHFFKNSMTGTQRYQFKVYDEPVLAAMSYLYPSVFRLLNETDIMTNSVASSHEGMTEPVIDTEASTASTTQYLPLDEAIIHSITRACEHAPSDERLKTMYSSILLVGGGHAFPGFIHILEDQLQIKQSNIPSIRFLSSPREMDPQMLAWKGASVFSQLKISRDFWVKQKEWDLLGLRCLQYKSLGYFWNG
ncbi:hypothetical protein PCK2_000409 [Pneumocystis canis]|nr:hypothetical protein PCK2_000409 [Pneumocystis canis]